MEEQQEREAKKAAKKEARDQRLSSVAGEIKTLRASYQKIKGSEAFKDLLSKVQTFADYHVKIAKDGVGYVDAVKSDGSPEQQLVTLTNEQKIDHIQRAAGIEEITDYIQRQLG